MSWTWRRGNNPKTHYSFLRTNGRNVEEKPLIVWERERKREGGDEVRGVATTRRRRRRLRRRRRRRWREAAKFRFRSGELNSVNFAAEPNFPPTLSSRLSFPHPFPWPFTRRWKVWRAERATTPPCDPFSSLSRGREWPNYRHRYSPS